MFTSEFVKQLRLIFAIEGQSSFDAGGTSQVGCSSRHNWRRPAGSSGLTMHIHHLVRGKE